MTAAMHRVAERIDGAHPKHPDYPLLPGDILYRHEDGTWAKECPGLGVSGFQLTAAQAAALEPVQVTYRGLTYHVGDPS